MKIPVLVEPLPAGFRASTGAPLGLSADGPTADAACATLQSLVADRLRAGAQIRALTVRDIGSILDAARGLQDNPLFDEFLKSVEEYRRDHNTVPDPDNPT